MRNLREYRRRAAVALRWRPEWRIAVVVVLAWIALLAGVGGHGAEPGHGAPWPPTPIRAWRPPHRP